MVKTFIKTEDRVQSFFKRGLSFNFDGETYKVIQSEKPTISANGECKTDLYVKAKSLNGKEKEFKFSIKQTNYWFVANKIKLERLRQIFGENAQKRISEELLKIKDIFYENKLIYYRGKDKNIRIGWKFEVGKGKGGFLSSKLNLTNDEKIDFYAGTSLPKEKKDALIDGVIVKDSGISNYIIVTDSKEKTIQDYAEKIQAISDYAPKVDLYFACKGINYRVNKNKWDGNRPLSVWVKWSKSVSTNQIDAKLIFDNPLSVSGDEVGKNIEKILNEIQIDDSNFEELGDFFKKFDSAFKDRAEKD